MSDEINIKEMPTDELLELMGEDLYDGYAEEVVEEVNEALSRGMTPYDVLTKGLVGGQYKPLKDEDVRRISDASFELLECVSIEVQPSECRDIFEGAGARIDAGRNRVYIPRGMVEDAMATAQNEVFLAGRDPRHDMILGGTRVYMGTGGAAVKILDLKTKRARETTLADVGQIGRLCWVTCPPFLICAPVTLSVVRQNLP